jgi:anti-sigma B factor antagonist
LEIVEEIQNGIAVYQLKGRLDSFASPQLETRIFQAIEDGLLNVVINFGALEYISSAGIRAILKTIKAVRNKNGRIMLCCMQDYVKEVFEISGVNILAPIADTMNDALKAF